MDDLEKLLNKQLENEDFKKEWEEFQPELQLMKKVIGEKIKQNRIVLYQILDKTESAVHLII